MKKFPNFIFNARCQRILFYDYELGASNFAPSFLIKQIIANELAGNDSVNILLFADDDNSDAENPNYQQYIDKDYRIFAQADFKDITSMGQSEVWRNLESCQFESLISFSNSSIEIYSDHPGFGIILIGYALEDENKLFKVLNDIDYLDVRAEQFDRFINFWSSLRTDDMALILSDLINKNYKHLIY